MKLQDYWWKDRDDMYEVVWLNKRCIAAYSGKRCEREEDNCDGVGTKCYHDGMCKDEHLGFSCLCRTTDVFTGKWCVFFK